MPFQAWWGQVKDIAPLYRGGDDVLRKFLWLALVGALPELKETPLVPFSLGFSDGSWVKNPAAVQETEETQVQSLGWEDPLETEMATHSSILAWNIPWTEEPGGLQSMGSQRRGHSMTMHV